MLRAKGAKNGTLGKRYILKLIHFAEKFAHIPHIQEAKKLEILIILEELDCIEREEARNDK